jgi:phosphate transport system substrate-binding protein
MLIRHKSAFALALCAPLVLGVPAAAAADPSPTAVEWSVPPVPTSRPQTDEEAAFGRANGRPAPAPEVLQPTLDPALPSFDPAYDSQQLTGNFRCAASDVLAVLSKNWIQQFQTYYPGVNISVDPPYAGSLGAVELNNGNLDCVFVSRELRPSDVQGFRDAFGYDPLSVPISGGSYRQFGFLDAVGFAVNPSNPVDHLSFDQLDAILSTTHARGGQPTTTWGQLGLTGDWADKPIHIYGVQPWNGFEEFVRQRVLSVGGTRGEWRSAVATDATPADPQVHWESTVFKLAGDIADDPYALGYTGLAYIDQPVKVLALSEHTGDPPVAPTYDDVATARYPLSRLTYLNMNKRPGAPLEPALAELTRFILSQQGQQVVRDQGIFLPLRANQSLASAILLSATP